MSDSLRRRFGAADAPLQSSIPAAAAAPAPAPAAAPLPHFCTDHAASTSTGEAYINLLSCFTQISSPWVEKGKIAQSYFFIIIFDCYCGECGVIGTDWAHILRVQTASPVPAEG